MPDIQSKLDGKHTFNLANGKSCGDGFHCGKRHTHCEGINGPSDRGYLASNRTGIVVTIDEPFHVLLRSNLLDGLG